MNPRGRSQKKSHTLSAEIHSEIRKSNPKMIQDPIKILRKCQHTFTSLDLHGHARIIYTLIEINQCTMNDPCTQPIFSRVQRSFFKSDVLATCQMFNIMNMYDTQYALRSGEMPVTLYSVCIKAERNVVHDCS